MITHGIGNALQPLGKLEGSFRIGDVVVTTQYLHHPALTLGYRIEADGVCVVYASDHEPHSPVLAEQGYRPTNGEDDRHARFIAGADLLIQVRAEPDARHTKGARALIVSHDEGAGTFRIVPHDDSVERELLGS